MQLPPYVDYFLDKCVKNRLPLLYTVQHNEHHICTYVYICKELT